MLRNYSDSLRSRCFAFLCFWYHKSFHSIFAFLVHQLCWYAHIVVFFWWFWVGVFCIQPFTLLLRLTSFRSMIFSLFFWSTTFLLLQVFSIGLLSVSSIHIHAEGWTIEGFQRADFGVNSDISVGEDGLHLGVCVFRQSCSCLYFCVASGIGSYCVAQVFKGAYLLYSFPFAMNVTYRDAWLFWDDHALSLLCIQLKSFVFTFDSDCCKDVL